MKLAIVGSGISGLSAGHLLHPHHEITLLEADDRLGGHTHTHDIPLGDRSYKVDTGFIVCNDWTYPTYLALMARVGVPLRASNMSFSVRNFGSDIEWAGDDLDTLFCQRRNLLRPRFVRMTLEILRFNKHALALAEDGGEGEIPLGEWLDGHGYSRFFQEHYVLPMGGAIWSTSSSAMRTFPAKFFARFFRNHGMLNVADRPVWRTVEGGSSAYIPALVRGWEDRVRLNSPVTRVERGADGVWLDIAGSRRERFDGVILACHADQALRMLADPSVQEQEILSALPYQENVAILHTDSSILPRSRKAWSSWNFHVLPEDGPDARVAVTYRMNRLQGLDAPEEFLVTLNHDARIDPSKILRRLTYHHPLFTSESVRAQARKLEIQGVRSTWYAGAYWSFGFHEDGCRSGVEAARALGAMFP